MKFKEKQKNNGITLIALVITIIVLLILAGVTIATLFGDNGVLTKATEAKNEQADATVEEAVKLAWNEYQMMLNEPTGKNECGTKIASTSKVKIQGQEENYSATPTMTFWQFLEEEKHYINEQGVIDVKTLVGETLSRGNGTDGTTDVYKIEETEDNGYVLVYYGEKSEDKTELATFTPGDSDSLEETDPSLFGINDGWIYIKDWESYYMNKKQWTVENVVIPNEINGEKVTTIGNDFMKNNYGGFSNVKTIVIPEGVETIGRYAFYGLNIEEITMPSSLTNIEFAAFLRCSKLSNITIPSNVTNIGGNAFSGCENLSNITIPSSVINIGYYAFGYCISIENIIIPSSVTNMEYNVFEGWQSNQSIYIEFSENEIPDTWSVEWDSACKAKIVFGYDPDYLPFAQEYLASKNQEELEELVLKTGGYPGTFDQFLTEVGMTRDEWEQQGTNEGMTYIEWLKDILVYGDNGFSWVRVEYEVSKSGGAGKNLGELETLFAQKYGADTFDELLAKDNITKEQFIEEIKNQGFRTEEDYLKYHLYYPA